MKIHYRPIKNTENPFLKEMLYEALFVPEGQAKFPRSIIEHPEIRKYIENWNGRKYDVAIVAIHGEELVGAIWGRNFKEENKGYGYVDAETPEISMAVKKEYRNKGVGTALLLQIELVYLQMGVDKISLSVAKLNPAKKLYDRHGYVFYEEQGAALTMIKVIKK